MWTTYSWFTWAMWKWNIFQIITRVFFNDKVSFFLFLLSFPHWWEVITWLDFPTLGTPTAHALPHIVSIKLSHHVPSLGAFNLASFQTISPHSRLCNKWLHHMASVVEVKLKLQELSMHRVINCSLRKHQLLSRNFYACTSRKFISHITRYGF